MAAICLLPILVGLPFAALGGSTNRHASATTRQHPHLLQRHVRFSFTLQNTELRLLSDVEVRAEAPARQNSTQRTLSVTASQPFELLRDAAGNQSLRFRLTLPPLGSKVIAVDAIVAFSATPRPDRATAAKAFL